MDNIKGLFQNANMLEKKTLLAIENDSDLLSHVSIVEKSMNVFHIESIDPTNSINEDQETIRLFGMRLFNGCGAALKLAANGYYQNSIIITRDLLETTFLMQYLEFNRSEISVWRMVDDKERKKRFSPVVIRKALDMKDGFEGKKRAESYSLLSRLGSHPTYDGFRMLAPKGHKHHCGPYFDLSVLKPVIEEIVKPAGQAASTFAHFFHENTKNYDVHLDFLEAIGKWMEKYMNVPFNQDKIDELKFHLLPPKK